MASMVKTSNRTLSSQTRLTRMDRGPQMRNRKSICRNMIGNDLPGSSYSYDVPTAFLGFPVCWVAVNELKLSYHNSKTIIIDYISILW